MPRSHRILGIEFFGGTSREAVEEITRRGGLLCAPAAPSMIALSRDEGYRRTLLTAEITIADSGFMVLLWKLITGESVPRISGLEHVKRLLEHESVRPTGAVLWVVATETSREKLGEFLGERYTEAGSRRAEIGGQRTEDRQSAGSGSGAPLPADLRPLASGIFVAPNYGRPIADESLLEIVRCTRPEHIVIAIGGGIQDKLGQYLLERVDYRPAVHCIGAALGFLTGDQVRIPDWADKYYLGWFFRSLAQPKVFVPRFWSARKLPGLIWRYRDRLPEVVKSRK